MKARHIALILAAVALVGGSSLVLAQGQRRGPAGWEDPAQHEGFGMFERGGRGDDGPLGHLGRVLRRLDLSDEQRQQVRGLVEAAQPELHALRQQLRANREAFREAHPPTEFDEQAIREQAKVQGAIMTELAVRGARLRADVLAVLTPEQLAEIEAMRAKMEEWRQLRREFWGGGH